MAEENLDKQTWFMFYKYWLVNFSFQATGHSFLNKNLAGEHVHRGFACIWWWELNAGASCPVQTSVGLVNMSMGALHPIETCCLWDCELYGLESRVPKTSMDLLYWCYCVNVFGHTQKQNCTQGLFQMVINSNNHSKEKKKYQWPASFSPFPKAKNGPLFDYDHYLCLVLFADHT